jgi:peptidoglycan/LPS O-acetylase OafA/YrhL
MHNLIIAEWAELDFAWPLLINWASRLIVILAASYAFYRVVEYPCHLLARRTGRSAQGLVGLSPRQ